VTAPGPDLLTTTQAAARAGVTERTMRKWLLSGKVGTHDTPEGRRVDRASLDAYRVERAKQAGNGAGPGTVATTVPGPDVGAELLTEVRALRRELAELRSALLTPQDATPEAESVRPDDPPDEAPLTRWERFRAWLAGG
jgi:excisionase family DNA binding protein